MVVCAGLRIYLSCFNGWHIGCHITFSLCSFLPRFRLILHLRFRLLPVILGNVMLPTLFWLSSLLPLLTSLCEVAKLLWNEASELFKGLLLLLLLLRLLLVFLWLWCRCISRCDQCDRLTGIFFIRSGLHITFSLCSFLPRFRLILYLRFRLLPVILGNIMLPTLF